jgi:hypothetical protein
VCLGAGIDRSANLRHPKADAVVGKHRESERELRPVKSTGGFPDYYGVEATVTRGDINKET